MNWRLILLFGRWALLPLLAVLAGTGVHALAQTSEVTTSFSNNLSGQLQKKVLRVTGDRDYPPYCYLDNGIPSGFDIDIIRAMATALDFTLEIELRPWSDARHLLQSGRADLIPGMARIPAREAEYDFSTPTKQLSFALFVPLSSEIKTISDARHVTLLVQKAGVMYDLIKQEGELTNIIPVVDAPDAIKRLAKGECDGAIVNRVQGHYIKNRDRLDTIKALDISFPTIPYCLAVRKGEVDLLHVLNEGLSIIKADGTYDAIYDQWFGLYDQSQHHTFFRRLLGIVGVISLLVILLIILNWSLRKQVQMRTSELRDVIDMIPYLIFARDRQGRYILANRATSESMSIPVNAIIGHRHADLYPDDPLTLEYMKEDQQVFATRQSLFIPETEHIDRKGKKHVLQVTKIPFQIKDGVPNSVLCVAVDVTELKQADEAVRSSREDLLITLNAIADGVIATDARGYIVRMNPVAEELAGIKSYEAIGSALPDMIQLAALSGESVDVAAFVQSALTGMCAPESTQSMLLTARNGTQRTVAMKWSAIRGARASITGMVIVLRDITEEIRINQRLSENQKMESIGRLAGGVAHDFNNLLAGIIGYAELLNISLAEHHECRTYVKGIFEASERARDLVQQLLTFSRRQPREVKPINCHTVIGHVISLLQHTLDRRITISRHFNATMFTVMGDRSQIQNSLLNLGVNARDAMPSGGSLTISTRNVILKKDEAGRFPHVVQPGPFIEILVADSGVGMDQETQHHIFEPFFTTKGNVGGTGLGLAAVYGAVKEHGGYIEVTSKPGCGSTFCMGLPVLEVASPIEDDSPEVSQIRGEGCILIVDDEPIVLKTIDAVLQSLGYTTLLAVNGREALSVYLAHQESIALVILDMIMPELNGKETFRELKKINPDIKVIISSGYLQDNGVEELMDMGILGVLQKPFRKHELAKRIAYVLKFGEHG